MLVTSDPPVTYTSATYQLQCYVFQRFGRKRCPWDVRDLADRLLQRCTRKLCGGFFVPKEECILANGKVSFLPSS